MLELELVLADAASVESQVDKRRKAATGGQEPGGRGRRPRSRIGRPQRRRADLSVVARSARCAWRLRPFFLLTNKPVIAVVNLGEDQAGIAEAEVIVKPVADELAGTGDVLGVSVQLEAEAAQLDAVARAELLEGLGLGEGALPRLAQAAYHVLGRRTFLTTGDKESRAWTFRAGAKAPECAGVIHSDLQRGFIRAEVIRWDELLSLGSWKAAKEAGKLRVEGKDYEVVDGDVLEIRFNV